MKIRAGLFAIGVGLVLSRESRAQTVLEADLLGSNELSPGWTEKDAVASVAVEGRTITLTITLDEAVDPIGRGIGLRPAIEPMAVHIHKGTAGVAGRLVVGFPWTPFTYGLSVTVTGQVPAGFAGKVAANPQAYYVELHTASFPAGAARGQLHAPIARPGPAGTSPLPVVRQTFQARGCVGCPGPGLGESSGTGRGAWSPTGPGFVSRNYMSGARPEPRPPRSPSRMTYEFFFHHFTQADEVAAGLIESEAPILRQVADDCVRALELLDSNQGPEETTGGDAADPSPLPDERSRVLDAYIAQLRSRLGEAAFMSLDGYVGKTFEADEDGDGPSGQPSRTRRADQTLTFPPPSYKIYRDPDFRLEASASSGLRVYYTASGDCSVTGFTVHILSAGNCWLTAHQPGNEEFNPAPDVDQRLRIEKAGQRISVSAIGPRTYREPDFPVGASASSGLPVVVGAIGKCSVDWRIVHLLGAGTCSLTVHQPGNDNYTAAPIVGEEFTIAKADQTISIPLFDNPPYGPLEIPLEPRASSGLPVKISTEGMCTFTGTALRILRSGTCRLIADQAGNEDFNAAPTVARVFEVVGYDTSPAPGPGSGEP